MNKIYPYNCFVSIFVNGTSVSTFLCTRKLYPEETEVLLQGSKWWLPHVWNSTTYYKRLLHHLYTVSWLYTTDISIICSFTFSCWSVAQAHVLLWTTPINWPSPWSDAYTMHTSIYIYIHIKFQAIIGMALWATKTLTQSFQTVCTQLFIGGYTCFID